MSLPHSYSNNDVLDIVKFEKAPCYRCGYNSHSYYQPGAHACAKDYHRIRDLMSELADPLIAAQRVFLLERCSGPNDEALEALIELHKYLDFEEPIKSNEAVTFDNPDGVNEAMAKAYSVIERSTATVVPTGEQP